MNPIIPEILKIISKNPEAIKITNRKEFDELLSQQSYFSASESHCFYNETDHQKFLKNKKMSETNCYLLYETGHIPVALWDNSNSIGFIVAKKRPMNKPTTGKYTQKMYRCTACGHEGYQGTNHYGDTYPRCTKCGWMRPMEMGQVHVCLEPVPEDMGVPESWKMVKLGDICKVTVIHGGQHASP